MAMFALMLTMGMNHFGMPARWVLVPQGDCVELTRSDGGNIRTIFLPDEEVIHIRTLVVNPAIVHVIGMKPGMTPITLTDREERDEKLLLIVLPKGAVRPKR